ncbi:single-stranded-DNA-specific exonuclease RecJ [Pikeienuella piscinae]|uniref:Single-stranded-DNA-specific exonuclease RecJ n=1 Tax=Pikeienuella piscinae TaxID=2748098 RepID=A0A7L5C148_9RHOB|nr:single-stranded-DNA-specific exonuclease RecJ [Pikeienuella piscinae]QIE56848.1 single-stranded-DNA-specific exonuclease RecJ [Pikeienuella piscinae]
MATERAFLDVESSVLGRRWTGPGAEAERMGAAITRALGAPEIIGRVLALRGVTPEGAAAHLDPTLKTLLPDPSTLRDMDRAAARLVDAVARRQRIAIFGDYDVDGGSSTALLVCWLRDLGREATVYIPDRVDEGYGPNVEAMTALAGEHDLIVCVDCGTLSHEPVAAAVVAGADVMIADHHLAGETLPECAAVVNPNRHDDESGMGHLCAAGVVFLLLVAANRLLRARGAAQPDLMAALDLVALATIADVAPLIGVNRAFVRQGLKVMAGRARPGLRALADIAKLTAPPSAFHLGYLLGPRVNAGGRIGKADLGARLLSTLSAEEASGIAHELDRLNAERRRIEAEVLEAATLHVEARGADGPLVWAAAPGWHPGVVGIVAARLKERFDRPAVVIGVADGVGKGSARSVEGVDLGAAVAALAREGALLKGGGHRMAAGLTVAADGIEAAMAALGAKLAKAVGARPAARALRIDGAVAPGAATPDLVEMLERAGPFGQAARAPRFAIPAVRVAFAKRAGESHLRLTLQDPAGGRLDAIAFRAFEGPLGPFLDGTGGAPVHLAGRLEIDDWGGRRKAKLTVEDAAPAG